MSEGFVLHGSPHSLYTYKVALMLRLCGIGFSFRYVSFQREVQRDARIPRLVALGPGSGAAA